MIVAVDRIFSIVFYMLIAAGTCAMAYRIHRRLLKLQYQLQMDYTEPEINASY